MANPSVIASQSNVEHFRNMIRLQYTTQGGAPTEVVAVGNPVNLQTSDFVQVLMDPNTNSQNAELIEVYASRSTTNDTITIGTSDGSNMVGGIVCEIRIIKRQHDQTGTPRLSGNSADSYWGHFDEDGAGTYTGTPLNVTAESITLDSVIIVVQTSQLSGLTGGLIEVSANRNTTNKTFQVNQANSSDSISGSATFDWICMAP